MGRLGKWIKTIQYAGTFKNGASRLWPLSGASLRMYSHKKIKLALRRLKIMNRWWCMDCRAAVELNRHGRCGCCESEAIDLMEEKGVLAGTVSMQAAETMSVPACS